MTPRAPEFQLVEFPADDAERARAFWSALLEAELAERTPEQGAGWQAGGMGLHERGAGPGDRVSLPYLSVDDLPATLEQVRALGGEIIHPGERWAVCRDSEGNPFALAARPSGPYAPLTMPPFTSSSTAGRATAATRTISTAQLLGQVMFLVAIAIGFLALGTVLGRDLAFGTARICSFGGFGMLMVSSFAGERFRVGTFAMGWLFATALLIGLGLGPVIAYFAAVEPDALTRAAGGTALIVAATGSLGFALSKDLARWMRPLSFLVFGLVIVSLVMVLAGSGGSPILSGAIALFSAALIVVDFNFLRKHGTQDHAVMLATGIFVSIVNIFLSLLNIFSSR